MVKKRRHYEYIPKRAKVFIGTISGILATTLLHPLDVTKVRMQMRPTVEGVSLMRCIIQREGYAALYAGIHAGIMRQICYTSTRIGSYYWLHDRHEKKHGSTPSLVNNVRYGVYAGLLGAMVGCPVDIVLVRMMADGANVHTRRYHGMIDAFRKITREDGIRGLWHGVMFSMTRSVFFSVVQIGSYSQIHDMLAEKRPKAKDFRLHVYTSLISSFITAVLSLPVDLVKTTYQAVTVHVHEHTILRNVLRKHGLFGFWRAFLPYYCRLSSYTILAFYLTEELSRQYREHFLAIDD
ncbi:mitochondrial 2-oxoglutarate/malate carrier protein-like [Anticarsia gemmatalis]|uniref:mitochondrial 2-oxoglutarate/malate carrier protein-like n=1 Tax=Anticarsia gemmatalis TaxID=129554 RepID=UPI003F7596FA